jgi:hypothetical protein
VLKQLQQVIQPAVALHEHYQRQWLVAMTDEMKLNIVRQAEKGAQALFAAGQQLWAPYLLGQVYTQCVHAKQTIDDLELGFDPWSITDPTVRGERQGNPKAVDDLTAFWFSNPNPGKSFRLYQEILAARERRLVRYVTGEAFPYCPWAPMWLAWRQVTIGDVLLEAGAYFSLYVGRNAAGDFVSEIRSLGRFRLEVRHMQRRSL